MIGNQRFHTVAGLEPGTDTCRATVREGNKARGDLVAFDLDNQDAATTTNAQANAASGWSNVREVDAADVQYGQTGICTEDITDDQEGLVCYRGRIHSKVIKASGNIAKGDPLYADATNQCLTADRPANTSKVIARAGEAVATPTTGNDIILVFFEGILSLGVTA